MTVETQLNPTQPVNQQIYRILRRDIVHCLIAPGTPLSEKEVSVRFNVSRQPVREAFIKLAENGNFHQLLTQIADCQLAWDTIENLKATVDRVRYMSFDHVSPPEMLLRQHLDIFSALQKRDGDAVERAMTQHLQEISESVRQIRQENSDWFSEE